METKEEWRTIAGYSNYAVSSLRRVKNLTTGRLVGHPNRTTEGSKDVALIKSDDGKWKYFTIERLFGESFGYQPPKEPGEVWKESIVSGVLVSSLGRLFSTWSSTIIKPTVHESGYLVYRRKGEGQWKVHRLVAMAFVPGRDLFRDCIDHINEDKTDNRAENLRWCTVDENNEYYATKHPYPVKISSGHRC